MLRTGAPYPHGIRDGRDMAHEAAHAGTLAYTEGNASRSSVNRTPTTKRDEPAEWRPHFDHRAAGPSARIGG